jgi:hypothetical protein
MCFFASERCAALTDAIFVAKPLLLLLLMVPPLLLLLL